MSAVLKPKETVPAFGQALTVDFTQNEFFPGWAAKQLKIERSYFGECSTIAVWRGKELCAVAVYSACNGINCEFTLAASTFSWLRRPILKIMAAYPFQQLGCRRMTLLVKAQNARVQNLARRLHFVREGCLREFFPDGDDCHVYGLSRKEYFETVTLNAIPKKAVRKRN